MTVLRPIAAPLERCAQEPHRAARLCARAGRTMRCLGVVTALTAPGWNACAGELLPEDLARRSLERRAIEAVVWGMPVVNYDLMLQEMLARTTAKVNQVIYWGRPLDWKNQTLTPNPDAPYFMAFFNTKKGPIVLDLPPGDRNGSFNGNIVPTTIVEEGFEAIKQERRRAVDRTK